uniref:AarF domain containing kinase 2 n=1 Tax=Neogobius melanostomus TaxID=47308 RepID=A0A8C6S4F7_9GOBI
MALFIGVRAALNFRHTFQRSCSFARIYQSCRTCLKRRPLLSHLPKVSLSLICCGAVSITPYAAKCQEATLKTPITERKSVAKVQVHKLIFVLRLSFRALVLLLKFGPLMLLFPPALVSTRWASKWLDALLWVTESSGPTFIKLGQWACTRRDIFPKEFCDRFCRLHVRVRPHAWSHTKQCLRRAFGEEWKRVFVFESKEPVGSGCVAQVYRGWARADRRLWSGRSEDEMGETGWKEEDKHTEGTLIPVAIKVVHPGVRRQVETDLLLMKIGSWIIDHLPGLKWLSLSEIVEEFEKLMTKQIDLRFEAKNIEHFRHNFRDVDYVKFPTPLRPFVTRTILVETFEESEPISNYLRSDIPLEVKQKIARMGVDTLLKMVFVDNFVHGDLHPGNILVQSQAPASTDVSGDLRGKTTLTDLWDTVVVSVRPNPSPFQLILLDAGIVSQLSEHDLANFKAVFTAVVMRKGERVAELILHHARANECQDIPQFKKEMAQLVDHALSNTLALGKIQVADLLSRVFGLLIKHKVKLESNFASIVFAIMVLEGLGRSLDPNLDILELAKPMLIKNSASLL